MEARTYKFKYGTSNAESLTLSLVRSLVGKYSTGFGYENTTSKLYANAEVHEFKTISIDGELWV